MDFFNSLLRRAAPALAPAPTPVPPPAVAAPAPVVSHVPREAAPSAMSMEEDEEDATELTVVQPTAASLAADASSSDDAQPPASAYSPLSSAVAFSAAVASTAADSSPATSSVASVASSSTSSPSSSTATASSSSSVASSSDPWLTLLRLRECFVYRLPSRVGLTPYQAEAWGLDRPLATVELHVQARDDVLHLCLIESASFGKPPVLFAQTVEFNCVLGAGSTAGDDAVAPIDVFLEPVRDSSRYFAIRVRDPRSGATSSLGVGFRERMSAFDLNLAIQDRVRSVRRHMALGADHISASASAADEAAEVARAEARLASHHTDLTLKQGERIKITLKTKGASSSTEDPPGGARITTQRKNKQASSSLSGAGPLILPSGSGGFRLPSGSGGFRLAPPPAAPSANEVANVDLEGEGAELQIEGAQHVPEPGATTTIVVAPTNLSPNLGPSMTPGQVAGEEGDAPPSLTLEPAQIEGDRPRSSSEGEPGGNPPGEDEDEFSDFAGAH